MGSTIQPLRSALLARCCRCGKGRIFKGALALVDECDVCGLAIKNHDAGDGHIFFVVTILCLLISGMAGWFEIAYTPPLWLHLVLWLPMTLLLTVVMLRFFKALMVAMELRALPENFE